MDDFVPGEYAQIDTIKYLEPTHFYGQDKGKNKAADGNPSGGDSGSNLLDMLGGGPPAANNPPPNQNQP